MIFTFTASTAKASLTPPAYVGAVKMTLKVQDAPAARLEPQLLVCEKPHPIQTPAIAAGEEVLLVRTRACGALDVPCGTVPKFSAVGAMVTPDAWDTVKLAEVVAVPIGVVTLIVPVVAPFGTDVEICVSEFTVNCADVPWKATAVDPVNPDPEIVMPIPTAPLVGVKELMTRGPITVKLLALVPVPAVAVTLMGPVVALEGTPAVI